MSTPLKKAVIQGNFFAILETHYYIYQHRYIKMSFENPTENLETQIASCEDINSLYLLLRQIGPIQGSSKSYDADEIIGYIEVARDNINSLEFTEAGELLSKGNKMPLVTRTFGLRDKVFELLKKEQEESLIKAQELESSPKADPSKETLQSRMENCMSFNDLYDLLQSILTKVENYESEMQTIESIRQGHNSIYKLKNNPGYRETVSRLLWNDPDQSRDVRLVDTPYVAGEKPWAIMVNWIYNGASGYTSSYLLLGMSDSDFGDLQETAEEIVRSNPGKYPNEQGSGLKGGAQVVVKDRRGKTWEVIVGSYQGSGNRPGISRIRPAESR